MNPEVAAELDAITTAVRELLETATESEARVIRSRLIEWHLHAERILHTRWPDFPTPAELDARVIVVLDSHHHRKAEVPRSAWPSAMRALVEDATAAWETTGGVVTISGRPTDGWADLRRPGGERVRDVSWFGVDE